MKRLHIHGLWLVLQIISTSQGNVAPSETNTVHATLMVFTPNILKSLNQETVYGSTSIVLMGEEFTSASYLQDTPNFRRLASDFTPERTPSQSKRNLYNGTRSKTARNIFKSTQSLYQTGIVDIKSITATGSVLKVQTNRTLVPSSETDEANPSTLDVQFSQTTIAGDSQMVQYTTGVGHAQSLPKSKHISSSHARNSYVHKTNISATNAFQSKTTESKNSRTFLVSKTIVVLSSRNLDGDESTSNNRFPPSTQTLRPSRIINASLSRTGVSQTERLDLKTRLSHVILSKSSINTHQSWTAGNLKTSETLHNYKVTSSTYRSGSQSIRHGNSSNLTHIVYFSSTTISLPKISINTHQNLTITSIKTSNTLDRAASSTDRGSEFSRHGNNSYLEKTMNVSATKTSRSHINTQESSTVGNVKTSKKIDRAASSTDRGSEFSRHGNNSYLEKTMNLSATKTSRSHINTQESSTLGNVKTSKTLDIAASSSYRRYSQFSQHENNSYLEKTVYLTSTTNSLSKSSINTHESSTMMNIKPSNTLDLVASSTYMGTQFSRHGNSSYLTQTVHLRSTTTANKIPIGRIQSTIILTRFQNISQTFAHKESINNVQSFSEDITSAGLFSNSKPSILGSQTSDYQFRTIDEPKVTVKKTDKKPQHLSTKLHILSSHQSSTIKTTRYQSGPGPAPSMPMYALAICLPVALLCGFTIALVYFKRNKEDQRARYSVTVEITSENPDYALKRMYSIIDVTSGINKDFLSGLQSRKASNATILDQLDGVSGSVAQPEQTV